jgi:anion-transporting  ArsA/GET3 family ATPase
MNPAAFCQQARVLVVAGKGGVGKTTVTAAMAKVASRAGLRTLIIEIEGKSGIGSFFGRPEPLTYQEAVLVDPGPGAAEVRARTLTPDDALVEYLVDHGLRRISKRLVSTGAVDVIATAVPGLRDILVLGKVKSLEKAGEFDCILLDAPAAGHAVTFLTSASGLLDAFRVGPIRTQAAEVVALLSDPRRCQVMLVTVPEETPVNEAVETAYTLEDRVGMSLGPIVVNSVYPEVPGLAEDPLTEARLNGAAADGAALKAAAQFRLGRQHLQQEQLARLEATLPLRQLRLPHLFSADIGPAGTDRLADALEAAIQALPDLADDRTSG